MLMLWCWRWCYICVPFKQYSNIWRISVLDISSTIGHQISMEHFILKKKIMRRGKVSQTFLNQTNKYKNSFIFILFGGFNISWNWCIVSIFRSNPWAQYEILPFSLSLFFLAYDSFHIDHDIFYWRILYSQHSIWLVTTQVNNIIFYCLLLLLRL